ncbi:hypothetical protein ACFXP3_09655 [Streptomyces sp. NPDC059096]|uniref:hypothetical protein n=1 Tax=Streptomyces sp. NPDC059096 TaxID=3346727 RepID=UPI0036BA8766
MHTSSYTVLYDPDGVIGAELPLDREPYECLVKAVLASTRYRRAAGWALADVVLREAEGRLPTGSEGTVHCGPEPRPPHPRPGRTSRAERGRHPVETFKTGQTVVRRCCG